MNVSKVAVYSWKRARGPLYWSRCILCNAFQCYMQCYSEEDGPFVFEESTCPIMHGDVVHIHVALPDLHWIGIVQQTSLERHTFTILHAFWWNDSKVANPEIPRHLVTTRLHALIQKKVIMGGFPQLIINDTEPTPTQLEWIAQTRKLEQFHFYYSHWALKELGFGRDLRSLIIPLIFNQE